MKSGGWLFITALTAAGGFLGCRTNSSPPAPVVSRPVSPEFRPRPSRSGSGGAGPDSPGSDDFNVIQTSEETIIITGYNGNQHEITIPSSISGITVSTIGEKAFYPRKFISVTISNGITSIGNFAFVYNGLSGVTIPGSVTSIGDFAFSYNKLTSITIPEGVAFIGNFAFYSNPLTSVTLPNSVISVGDNIFSRDLLRSVTLPGGWEEETIKKIGGGSLASVYTLQNRQAGTYVKTGQIWRLEKPAPEEET